MPELPEVERRPEVTAYPAAEEFCRRIAGQTVSYMGRRGKFLTIGLHNKERAGILFGVY